MIPHKPTPRWAEPSEWLLAVACVGIAAVIVGTLIYLGWPK